MWQRFTERARRVILYGQEEAGRLESKYVGTEHLLLGLTRENKGSGARVLENMGVSLDQVRAATLAAMSPALNAQASGGEPKLTPKAKRVLELADDEARAMRHSYIGTEHLLMALLREKDGMACAVLRGLTLELENTRAQVTAYLEKTLAPIAATAPDSPGVSGAVAAVGSEQSRVAPAVRTLLGFAAHESLKSGSSQIEIVHLLRALCREESESARILGTAGVSIDDLRTRLEA